jgi:hypothetical protein
MPGVLLRRLVDLGKLFLGWTNLVSGLLGSVRGDVANQYGGIAH